MTSRRQFIFTALLAACAGGAALIPSGCSRRQPVTVPVISNVEVNRLYDALKVHPVRAMDTAYAPLDPAWFLDTFCPSMHAYFWDHGFTKPQDNRLDCDKFSRIAMEQMLEWNAQHRTDAVAPAFGTCSYFSYEYVGYHMITTGIVWRGGQNFEVIFWEPQQAILTPTPKYEFKTLTRDELSYGEIAI